METQRWLTNLRWVSILPVVVASLWVLIYFSLPFDDWVYNTAVNLGFQEPIDERLPPYLPMSFYGALAAVVVVLSGSFTAPAQRRVVALCLYGTGCILVILGGFLIGPFIGGGLAVGAVFFATRQSVVKPPLPLGPTVVAPSV
jgi:hypothetical protein